MSQRLAQKDISDGLPKTITILCMRVDLFTTLNFLLKTSATTRSDKKYELQYKYTVTVTTTASGCLLAVQLAEGLVLDLVVHHGGSEGWIKLLYQYLFATDKRTWFG
eukprot:scaffold13613_cov114-Cylindrotheca_fusiformis.AAC.4